MPSSMGYTTVRSGGVIHRLKTLCEIVKQKINERLNPRYDPPPVAIQQSSAVIGVEPMPLQLVLFQEMPKHRLAFPTSSSAPDTAIAWPPADQRTTGSASGFPETQPSQRSYGPLSILQNGASTVPAWTTSLAQSMSSFSPSHSSKTKEEPYSSTTLLQCTCDYNIVINKSVHAAVEDCHGMSTPYNMPGEYVVMSGQQGSYTGTAKHEFKDITLADFRHALGWFSTYFDDTALGPPIRVCQLAHHVDLADETTEEETSWTNPYTLALKTKIDPEPENWGNTRRMLISMGVSCSVDCMKALSGEISRQDGLDEITLEKATAWKPIDAYTEVTAEQPRPQRGFVRRMGSSGWDWSQGSSYKKGSARHFSSFQDQIQAECVDIYVINTQLLSQVHSESNPLIFYEIWFHLPTKRAPELPRVGLTDLVSYDIRKTSIRALRRKFHSRKWKDTWDSLCGAIGIQQIMVNLTMTQAKHLASVIAEINSSEWVR
ncbi:hypothetical protein Y699_08815 [Aspergillus fumigatus Z5]|nr:hypothetical protein Y699_08815 [Aspergillus fumigatus Z5]